MIVEHALLHIKAGQSGAFVAAMRKAKVLIAASPGFVGIEVRAAAESEDLFLLTVSWKDITSHRDGFRKSARYEKWRALLHDFYAPMPEISYFGDNIFDAGNFDV